MSEVPSRYFGGILLFDWVCSAGMEPAELTGGAAVASDINTGLCQLLIYRTFLYMRLSGFYGIRKVPYVSSWKQDLIATDQGTLHKQEIPALILPDMLWPSGITHYDYTPQAFTELGKSWEKNLKNRASCFLRDFSPSTTLLCTCEKYSVALCFAPPC